MTWTGEMKRAILIYFIDQIRNTDTCGAVQNPIKDSSGWSEDGSAASACVRSAICDQWRDSGTGIRFLIDEDKFLRPSFPWRDQALTKRVECRCGEKCRHMRRAAEANGESMANEINRKQRQSSYSDGSQSRGGRSAMEELTNSWTIGSFLSELLRK
jgi:hypothetical protein